MSLTETLENLVGTSINNICDGKFHDTSLNHCAHFVSHVLGFDFTYDCKAYKGGNGTPANVRVQEIFPKCPKVGHWKDANLAKDQLAFVTKAANVDLSAKTIVNIPKKHVGIYSAGHVYHYSKSKGCVVKDIPEDFSRIYSGQQGMFFGTFPDSDLHLSVKLQAADVPQGLRFDLVKSERSWDAQPNGRSADSFYVGYETGKGKYIGLMMPIKRYYGPQYRASDYVDQYDHWAQLLELTGYCESKNFFNVINTYDSAKFTFGFYQLAAHTANDNLILLFRRLLKLPEAAEYFPELTLINARIHRVNEDGGKTDLEVEMKTGPRGRSQPQLFMNFLNAKLNAHDIQEVLQSARLIHWSNTHASNRDAQVGVSIDILQRKMSKLYAKRYDLDGCDDTICALIADIHHQGRASVSKVKAALKKSDPINALIDINPRHPGRILDLRRKFNEMVTSDTLGKHTYDAALNEFVPK